MSPWPPPLTNVDEDLAWSRRARIYRRQHPWCALCERRTRLQIHHRRGRGVFSAVGYEDDDELMTLCAPCHQRITKRHRWLGRQRHEISCGRWDCRRCRGRKIGTTVNPADYSHTIAEVTAAARPRYLVRAFRRMLHGLPTPPNPAVIIPRR